MGENFLKTIDSETGERPDSCPWMAFHDPLVSEVLKLYRACSGEMGAVPALAMHLNPSNIAFDGLLFYCGAVNRIRAADFERERKRREAEKKSGGLR